jgi:hypothetical protein
MKRKLGESTEKVGLPPFTELEKYAADDAEMPERFYLEPGQEGFSDWSLATASKDLKVHSAILGLACKFFESMLNDGLKPQGPIKNLPVAEIHMAQALGFLRFIYDPDSLIDDNILHLARQRNISGVLRLAHSLNSRRIFERCKRRMKDSLEEGPRVGFGRRAGTHVHYEVVRDIRDLALDIKDFELQDACCTYVSRWCHRISDGGDTAASFEDSVALVRELGDHPELLRAGLFSMLHRNHEITGITIRRTFDDDDFLSRTCAHALFTFKFQLSAEALTELRNTNMENYEHSFDPEDDERHAQLRWNDRPYKMRLELCELDYENVPLSVYPALNLPEDQPGPRVGMTFFLLNWKNPARSIRKEIEILYPIDEANCDNRILFSNDPAEILSFLDERGCLYVLLEEIKVLSIEPPQT